MSKITDLTAQLARPVVEVYVFLQRYFIEGVERSGLAN